ncbi:MAG: hypothetical protein KKA73_13620, partial [Chloroflexi bacterium]|nr:hypothetical protein [Chloroflexota bacterium]
MSTRRMVLGWLLIMALVGATVSCELSSGGPPPTPWPTTVVKASPTPGAAEWAAFSGYALPGANRVLAVGDEVYASSEQGVYVRRGATQWEHLAGDNAGPVLSLFAHEGVLYAGGLGRITRRNEAGAMELAGTLPEADRWAIYDLATDGTALYVATNGRAWHAQWSDLDAWSWGDLPGLENRPLYAVHVADGIVYAGGAGGLWVHNGITWAQTLDETTMALADWDGRVVAGTSAGLVVSENQGQTWQAIPASAYPELGRTVRSLAWVGGTLYGGGTDGVYALAAWPTDAPLTSASAVWVRVQGRAGRPTDSLAAYADTLILGETSGVVEVPVPAITAAAPAAAAPAPVPASSMTKAGPGLADAAAEPAAQLASTIEKSCHPKQNPLKCNVAGCAYDAYTGQPLPNIRFGVTGPSYNCGRVTGGNGCAATCFDLVCFDTFTVSFWDPSGQYRPVSASYGEAGLPNGYHCDITAHLAPVNPPTPPVPPPPPVAYDPLPEGFFLWKAPQVEIGWRPQYPVVVGQDPA